MNATPRTGERSLERLRGTLAARASSPAATLVVLDGEAEAFEPTSRRWHAATRDAVLSVGQRLRVKSGRAMLRLSDGSDVWMASGAEIDLSPWTATARALGLAAGHILALVARSAGAAFRTLTPHGEILVTGTAFEASATPGELAVRVLHGSIRLGGAAGRLDLRAGRGGSVRPGGAPAAHIAASHPWGGFGDIAASSGNAGIAPAYRAARRQLDKGPHKEGTIMRRRNIIAAAALVAAILLIIAWRAPEVLGIEPGGTRIVYIDREGRQHRLDSSTPAALEASLATIPAEHAATIRAIHARQQAEAELMRSRYGAFAGGPGEIVVSDHRDVNDPWEQLLDRERTTALKSFRDMVDRGVDAEKARAAVERAFEDSIRAQRKQMPGFADAKVQARATIEGEGPSARLRFEVSTSRTSAKDAPPDYPSELKDAALRAHEAIDEDADPSTPPPNPQDFIPKR